jgi:trans-2-enoyl-CoA reductase
MVGLAVIQMARELGIKTINVVRSDRPSLTETIRLLTNLGGDINITDKYLETSAFNDILKDLPPVKLALNCVGGEVATSMARVLAPNGT